MGRVVSVAMMASLVALSARSLPGIMVRDPLDKDWRWNGTDGIADGERSRMWCEGFTQGLTVCAKEYCDWMMVGIGESPG